MQTINEKLSNAYEVLKDKYGYKNRMQSPRVQKISVSVGVGRVSDKKKKELIADRISRITGQKPSSRGAKKSIATFKVREGDEVGLLVTLRGIRATGFLEKLINVALPRTRDFRGIARKAVDNMGNITIGLTEHTIFPETSDEELRDVFGMAITIITTAPNREQALAYFEHIGIPFSK
jgi:large subunit ribosomal protein L5